MTRLLKKTIPKRTKVFQKWIYHPSTENQQAFKVIRNKISLMIRHAKRKQITKKPTTPSIKPSIEHARNIEKTTRESQYAF